MDVFAIAGTAKAISGTGTLTALPNCPAALVGFPQTIIPSNAAGFSITATATIVVDGATSGTYLMPFDANIQIIATSMTKFKITTIFATGTWTPTDSSGAGLILTGIVTSWVKEGGKITATGEVNYPVTANAASAALSLPFTATGKEFFAPILTTGGSASVGYIGSGTTSIIPRGLNNATITNAGLSGALVGFTATYFV
jgi:hypothetical protein